MAFAVWISERKLRPTTLGDLARATAGKLTPPEASNVFVTGVSTDTRELYPGDVFFALIADRNGHNFIEEAVKAGAAAAVISEDIQTDIATVRVSDTLRALNDLATKYRRYLKIPIIAITGSLGKTTVREAIAYVLSVEYRVAQSERNFNNLIGLPLSILRVEENHDIAVLELGINLPGEMDRLASIVVPDYAVLLNVAPVHLEGLGSLDRIASEKLRLLEHTKPNAKLFLNADDKRLATQSIIPPERVITFGFSSKADFVISDFAVESDGSTTLKINGEPLKMRICGRCAPYCAASAFAVGSELGIRKEDILERLAAFEGVSNRLKIKRYGQITALVDVYNSSPLAVESALETLAKMNGERKVAILADMLELGKDELKFHKEMGKAAAEKGIDALFLYGKLSKAAADGAIEAGMASENVFWTDDFEKLEASVKRELKPGDIVLIKGSRAMKMERLLPIIENIE